MRSAPVSRAVNKPSEPEPHFDARQRSGAVQGAQPYDYDDQLAQRVAALTPARAEAEAVLVEAHSVTMVLGAAAGIADLSKHVPLIGALKLPQVVHDEDEDSPPRLTQAQTRSAGTPLSGCRRPGRSFNRPRMQRCASPRP